MRNKTQIKKAVEVKGLKEISQRILYKV